MGVSGQLYTPAALPRGRGHPVPNGLNAHFHEHYATIGYSNNLFLKFLMALTPRCRWHNLFRI